MPRRFGLSTVGPRLLVAVEAECLAVRRGIAAASRFASIREFPPSAMAQLVSDMMADAIVRHAGELFADDPVGQVAAAHAKVLLDAVRNHAEDETHAEPAESAAPAPHAESAEGSEEPGP